MPNGRFWFAVGLSVAFARGFQPPLTSGSNSGARRPQNARARSSALFASKGRKRAQHKDVVIVGGGLAGLSAALYLTEMDPKRQITVLDREDPFDSAKKTSVASFAAAGMLAPQSERLPKGHLLDLCMESKRMYPDFVDMVESMARESGEEGEQYLWASEDDHLEPWSVGYMASGGFLAPAFAGDNVATWAPPDRADGASPAMWLDAAQVKELEPNLHPDVVGGWWFPEDASVDARRLTCGLRAACVGAGVRFLSGANYEVSSLDLSDGRCHGLWLRDGRYLAANAVLVANGSWMRTLLPVPIEPHKGQSLSLRMPRDRPPVLRRVLFAQDSYIVPKADGRIVIGATVEAGSYDPHVTPAGLLHILTYALEVVPGLASLPIEETWAGLRPTTPDKGPILGKTPWKDLYLAGGYWRNGVLLAPKTGELIASLIAGAELDEGDARLLDAFAWDRFTGKDRGADMVANARFAAAQYPIHTRRSGAGVSAAVGTELGSYSDATAAKEEREKDRAALWDEDAELEDSDMDIFEQAASQGQKDGASYYFSDDGPMAGSMDDKNGFANPGSNEPKVDPFQEDEYDSIASSVSSLTDDASSSDDLSSVYKSISDNKAKAEVTLQEKKPDERPDPGFRIEHIEKGTGIVREVPPYTNPEKFLAQIKAEQTEKEAPADVPAEELPDGYQTIEEFYEDRDNEEIRENMKATRIANRGGSDFDLEMEDKYAYFPGPTASAGPPAETSDEIQDKVAGQTSASDLSDVYDKIKKAKDEVRVQMGDAPADERPDPGFRIYHIDKETGLSFEIPPYTTPGAMNAIVEAEKQAMRLNGTLPAIPSDETQASPANGTTRAPVNDRSANGNAPADGKSADGYSEKTYDGYQDILDNNSSPSREEELEAMRKVRLANRQGSKSIDEEELHL